MGKSDDTERISMGVFVSFDRKMLFFFEKEITKEVRGAKEMSKMYDLMETFKIQSKYCAMDEELKDIRIWYSNAHSSIHYVDGKDELITIAKESGETFYYRDNQMQGSGKGILIAELSDNGRKYTPNQNLNLIPEKLFKITQLYRNDDEYQSKVNTRKLFGVDLNADIKKKTHRNHLERA